MSTDEKPTSSVVPEANPEVKTPATKKPAKGAKPKAAANKPVSGPKAKRAAAQPVEETPAPAITEAAPQPVEPEAVEPQPVETEGESRAKKEKKKGKKKHKKSKEAVIIRFDDTQLPQIDARAEALGLSRAAWVRMVVAKALS